MAWEACRATMDRRAVAEQALRDYTSFAAEHFVADFVAVIYIDLASRFGPLRPAAQRWQRPGLANPIHMRQAAEALERCECALAVLPATTHFRLTLDDSVLVTEATGALSPAAARWVRDTVLTHARGYPEAASWTTIIGGRSAAGPDTGRAEPLAILYTMNRERGNRPAVVYGMVADARALVRSVVAGAFAKAAPLPLSVTGGRPIDSVITVGVLDTNGVSLFRSGAVAPSSFATVPFGEHMGGLRAVVGLRSDMADWLNPAGVTRLPSLLGLFVLTAVLLGIALVQLRREQELARLRADFTTSISHELRTPLAQILLFGETLSLERVHTRQEQLAAADIIVQETRRLMTMVENVLHFSRGERGVARVVREDVALEPLVRATLRSFAPLAGDRRVVWDVTLAPVSAPIDRHALQQILLNLLDNAVKYGPEGQTIGVRLERYGSHARIAVEDEGPGIPVSDRARVWRPYVRLDRALVQGITGSGLGLAVVWELVAMHGGSVRIEDGTPLGTRMVVELPGAHDSTPEVAGRTDTVPAGMTSRPQPMPTA